MKKIRSDRKKLDPESVKIVVSLTLIALVAALLLAVVNIFTRVDEAEEMQNAVAENYSSPVASEIDISGYDDLGGTELQAAYIAEDGAYIFLVHVAKGNRIGYSADGVGLITVIKDGVIVKVAGYSHSETPGLGANAFREDYLMQYSGVNVADIYIPEDDTLVFPDNSGMFTPEKVTSATYTTNAVFAGVKGAVKAYGVFAEGSL